MADTVEIQMKNILEDASKEVRRAAAEAGDKTANEAKQMLRNTSPKGSPHRRKYAEGWAVKREKGSAGVPIVTVYNRTNGPLTHLLENGHVVSNKYGTYGRTNGIKHVAPVNDWAQTALPENFEREFKP